MPAEYFKILPKIKNEGETKVVNPYSAFVVTDSEFTDGRVRIEPPFFVSENFLESILNNDVDVELRYDISGQESTLLSFLTNTDSTFAKSMSNEERVRHTVQTLIIELGKVASEINLRKEYRLPTTAVY